VTFHGTGHFVAVEDVARHYFQSLMHLSDFFGGSHIGRNKMAAPLRQANKVPANAAGSAKNEQFHSRVSVDSLFVKANDS
jgi:hypothetical protein